MSWMTQMQPSIFAQSKYAKLLDDYCRDQGFGSPHYECSIVNIKDNFGRDVQSFNYKITVPALLNNYGSFQWTKLWPTDVEAREAAAQFVCLQLGMVF